MIESREHCMRVIWKNGVYWEDEVRRILVKSLLFDIV